MPDATLGKSLVDLMVTLLLESRALRMGLSCTSAERWSWKVLDPVAKSYAPRSRVPLDRELFSQLIILVSMSSPDSRANVALKQNHKKTNFETGSSERAR